jgi:hypothetical protein
MPTKIGDFAAAQTAFHNRLDTAVSGLTADIEALNDKITELQNTQGQITPEDQTLLDAIQVRGEAIAAKLDALDALTPTVTPPNPTEPETPPTVPNPDPNRAAPNPDFGPQATARRAQRG